MQQKLGKAVRAEFSAQLEKHGLNFAEDRTAIVPSGCKVFRCSWERSAFFIVLLISPKDDRFTVEIGWNEFGIYPMREVFGPDDPPKDGGQRFRLSALWHPQHHDYWWVLGRQRTLEEMANFIPDQPVEERLPDVVPKVSEAIEKIVAFGLPYFERIAAEKGMSVEFTRRVAPKQKQ